MHPFAWSLLGRLGSRTAAAPLLIWSICDAPRGRRGYSPYHPELRSLAVQ
jgi:hypothetical protein